MNTRLDGRELAAALRVELESRSRALSAAGVTPHLAILAAGSDEASELYAARLERLCAGIGVETSRALLPAGATTGAVVARLRGLAEDPAVHGILVQAPLPPQVDLDVLSAAMPYGKDVDGLGIEAAGRLYRGLPCSPPATAVAVMELIRHHRVPVDGAEAVVVGRSVRAGRPVAMLLLHAGATVTIAHSRTADLPAVCRRGDILVAALGRPGAIGASMVKEGAHVFDVGINVVDGRVVGDVAYDEAVARAAGVTPVPGGVGPVTNVCLVKNLLDAVLAREP